MKPELNIYWMRRDLRLNDNAALWHALRSDRPVLCIFIFDKNILDKLTTKKDARVLFIHQQIQAIKQELEKLGSTLELFYSTPQQVFKELTDKYSISAVYTNRDYEPYAIQRDKAIYEYLKNLGIQFKGSKDHVIFDKHEVTKDDGLPYTVFTPYSKKWKSLLTPYHYQPYPTERYFKNFFQCSEAKNILLEEMGFENFEVSFPSKTLDTSIVKNYDQTRDTPSIKGTTRISMHLRFGTVSIRELCRIALSSNEKWLNELIWRDFYQAIIYHFPHSAEHAFKPAYDRIKWINDEQQFAKWCKGETGYPIVDAGMRELNATGFMHNRVRMIVASFLTKHLLIDWRWGERYFAEKLLDYELASNVGSWQWAASSGCDAAPYFRVFNPELQTAKFDPQFAYIKKWVPEFQTSNYPRPIVEHKFARDRVIATYKQALSE